MNERIEKKNIEKEMEKENKRRQIAQLQENKREDIRKWIEDKNEKIEEFKRQKELINENKRLISDEIARRKEEYSSRFQQIFQKKNIDENTLKTIQEMFPNNKEIENLIDEYNALNTNEDNKKNRNTSATGKNKYNQSLSNYGYDNNFEKNNRNKFADDGNKTYDSNTNINNYNDSKKQIELAKQNIYEKYNIKPLPNKRFNVNDNNNSNSQKNESNTYNNNFNDKKNKKISIEMNNENEQKLNDYKSKMNKELLDLLRNERKKEELRERQLEELDINDPQREVLERKFGEERARISSIISQKNSEIEQKISEYEMKLKKNY